MKKIFGSKKFKYGLNAVILTISIIGIVVLLNILLNKYSYTKDVTQNGNFVLSQQTKNVLSNLDKSGRVLNVHLFTGPGLDVKTENMIEGLLKQYAKSSKNFKLQPIDLEKNPSMARKYGIASTYEVVFDLEGRTKTVALMDMFEGMNFNGEQAYTSAMNTVMNENPSVVYIIQGHKELSLDKDATLLKKYIEREGYVIKTLNLATEGRIPEDASMLVDLGARADYPQKELDILKGYLDAGGKLIFLSPNYDEITQTPAANEFFKNYGISVNNDVVIDNKRNFYGVIDMVIPEYENHEIVNNLKEQQYYYMVLPAARSINVLQDVKDIKVESLLKSSNDSWGETNLAEHKKQKSVFDGNDRKGPLTLGAYITKQVGDKHMEIVVVGNDLLVSDDALQNTKSGANLDFMLNAMGALSDVKNAVTIRSKPTDIKPIILTPNVQRGLGLILIILVPGAILTTGLGIWLRRRHL